MCGGVHDVITSNKFHQNRSRGFRAAGVWKSGSPIDLACRPYNSSALPCWLWLWTRAGMVGYAHHCLRIGHRFNISCAQITTSDGHSIPWVEELRYLGVHIVTGRQFKCSLTHAKQSFYRPTNAIFGKISRIASEEIILQLINCKCMPILLYGLECFSVAKHDVRSLDFAVTWFLMKLFRSSNINVIDECRLFLNFMCYPAKRLKKEETVSRVNSRIVPVCCKLSILTYVHNYVNIVTVDYLLSCLVKLVKIYSFYSFFQ